MLNVKDFGFKNLDKIDFVMPPKCDCEKCDGDLSLVIKEDQKVEEVAVEILYNFDCCHVGALVMRDNNESMVLLPGYLEDFDDEGFNMNCLSADNISEKDSIEFFANCVNDLDLHTLLILKEDRNEENVYDFIYK